MIDLTSLLCTWCIYRLLWSHTCISCVLFLGGKLWNCKSYVLIQIIYTSTTGKESLNNDG